MQCGRCGSTNPAGSDVRYCRTCGERLTTASECVASALAAPGGSVPPIVVAAPALAPLANSGVAVALTPPAVEELPLEAATVFDRSLQRPAPSVQLPPVKVLMLVSPYGGFWVRFGASVVDGTALIIAGGIASSVVGIALGLAMAVDVESAPQFESLASWALALIAFVLSIVYFVVLPPLAGATPGKLALGYEIVGPDGRRVSIRRSVARYLACIPSALALGVGYAWIGVDSHKQGWHDKIAGTYVIRKDLAPGPVSRSVRR